MKNGKKDGRDEPLTKKEFEFFKRGEFQDFKDEMYEFKTEMYEFKDEMMEFKAEMYEFRDEMRQFRSEIVPIVVSNQRNIEEIKEKMMTKEEKDHLLTTVDRLAKIADAADRERQLAVEQRLRMDDQIQENKRRIRVLEQKI